MVKAKYMKQERPTVVIAIPPKAQPLDVSGPLSAFREAYRQSNGKISYNVKLMSISEEKDIEIDGMNIVADCTIKHANFPIDTLLIAGTHEYQQALDQHDFTKWLVDRTPDIRRYGSVCTGAFFLGAAGLLDGRKATTHWQQAEELITLYPKAKISSDAIYILDGTLCTSAGITAGIDLSLKLIEDDYGRELALKIARRLVVFFRRPGGQSQFSVHVEAQATEGSRIENIQSWILEHIHADLSLPTMASHAGMSIRNFTRVFRNETGITPTEFVERTRIDYAKKLLEDSDQQLQQVASKCGFTNIDIMRRTFIRHLSISPNDYRKRFHR